ncbi:MULTISPECIES: collagen-like triple helix repeat-containing protein [Halomonadaceae]|uniref:Bacterial collagen-like protein middle domain-containing protein n=1 Tax=Billgrantia aerodenitrificans TaxID=2733483 RepID=A0ABS9AYB2_9GAMM|nr:MULTISPECIES: collagen-like triple helix repeat-containing protein [Halomonas]MCE8026907.1 hypothetical protein [Halomonas aerodenitrificans]MCE8040313.1 hypothetical protein [Halomonas sp. MCCC 1A11062]
MMVAMNRLLPLAALTTAILLAGCSGTSSSSQPLGNATGPGSPGGGNGGTGGVGDGSGGGSGLERIAQSTSEASGGLGDTIATVGDAVTQLDAPLVGAITDGGGNVVIHLGDGVNTLADGIGAGLGDISENDNALGTTLAGVTGAVGHTGQAVSAAGTTVEALNTLPVFLQVDEATGLLTGLGGTVEELGGTVTATADALTLSLTDENAHLAGLTTELTAVVRPLVVDLGGITQNLGDALVVGPPASNLLQEVGGVVVMLGDDLASGDALLAGVGTTVTGAGQLIVDTGGLLSANSNIEGGLLRTGPLSNTANEGNLLGGNTGLLGGAQKGSLLAGDSGLIGGVTGTVDGLTGSLLGGSQSGGLLGGDKGLLGGVTGTVDGLTGSLLAEGDGRKKGGGLLGGLLGSSR